MKKLFTLLLLLISIGLHAQTCGPGSKDSVCSYGPITIASGVTTSLPSNGGLVPGFQYIFSSGSGTVTLHGCIGPIATGCVTLDSYTGGTTVRTPDEFSVKAPSAPYQYFTITPTYGAGTFTVLEVNNNTSKVGGSKLDLTATSPIVVTPNPITGTGDISCPTCGISFTAGGDLSGTSSSQTVVGFDGKALDTSMGTPSNGNIPTYDSGAGKWKAAAPAPPAVNAGECEMVVVGTGASYVLTTGDGTFYNGSCFNGSASTVTITGVYCLADTGTTTTVTPIVHGGGTILTGALTCGNNAWSATGTLSGTPTLSSGASVDPGMTATGTGHAFHIAITYH
jgi:hypothetical protein